MELRLRNWDCHRTVTAVKLWHLPLCLHIQHYPLLPSPVNRSESVLQLTSSSDGHCRELSFQVHVSPMANMMNSVSCDNFVSMSLLYVFLLSSCEGYVCTLVACLASDVCFVDTWLLLCGLSFRFITLVFKSRLCHSCRPAWLEPAWPSLLRLLCASITGLYCHSQLLFLLLHIVEWLCTPLIPALRKQRQMGPWVLRPGLHSELLPNTDPVERGICS